MLLFTLITQVPVDLQSPSTASPNPATTDPPCNHRIVEITIICNYSLQHRQWHQQHSRLSWTWGRRRCCSSQLQGRCRFRTWSRGDMRGELKAVKMLPCANIGTGAVCSCCLTVVDIQGWGPASDCLTNYTVMRGHWFCLTCAPHLVEYPERYMSPMAKMSVVVAADDLSCGASTSSILRPLGTWFPVLLKDSGGETQ